MATPLEKTVAKSLTVSDFEHRTSAVEAVFFHVVHRFQDFLGGAAGGGRRRLHETVVLRWVLVNVHLEEMEWIC